MPTNLELNKLVEDLLERMDELESRASSPSEQPDIGDFCVDVMDGFDALRTNFKNVIEALERLDRLINGHMRSPDAHNPAFVEREIANSRGV